MTIIDITSTTDITSNNNIMNTLIPSVGISDGKVINYEPFHSIVCIIASVNLLTVGTVIGVALLILMIVVILVIVCVFVQRKRKTQEFTPNKKVCQFILNNPFHVMKHILVLYYMPLYGQYNCIYCAIPNI